MIVTIKSGKIEGSVGDGVREFKGIPFAEKPVGDLRWASPTPVAAWEGVMETTSYGPGSVQADSPMGVLFPAPKEKPVYAEDCLTLNVWTPEDADGSNPVMVWIHGGAFTQGSGGSPMYDGTTFAKRGVVVVSINYRLGALGFLRLVDITNGKIAATGMEGILDQVCALSWVQDNIAVFGGDSGNVTIFGESAGGMSVGTIMAMPAAQSLYHRAIPQSGAGHNAVTVDRANQVAELLLEKLGIGADEAEKLRAVDAESLLAAQQALQSDAAALKERGIEGMAFQPVIDGGNLPDLPVTAIAGGIAAGKSLLVGNTEEENKLFVSMMPGGPELSDELLREQLGAAHGPDHVESLISVYQDTLAARGTESTPAELSVAIETDQGFRIPAVRFAEAQGQHSEDVFMYLFDWKTQALEGRLGSCHALEIPFVFGSHQSPGLVSFAGGEQSGADALADAMQSAWVAFARTGNPGVNGPVAPYAENRTTMMFGTNSRIEQDPAPASREIWDTLDPS